MSNYDNFVFYGSWRETLEGFAEDFGKEYAQEALWNLMLSGTAGDMETSKKSIINWVNGSCMDNINSAKNRYAKAVENGKKGGRPTEVDTTQITELKAEGLTHNQIATELGCSTKTVQRALKQVDKSGQNLDIDIDIDIDKDIDIEKEKEKDIPTDVAIAIIDMFKAKNKYKDIQAKIKTDFNNNISFDDIKQVIDNKSSYITLAEKEKETKTKNYFRQVEYNCIPDVIEKLATYGIITSYDEVKTAYDEVQDSNLCSKWSVRDLVSNCYLNPTFIGDTKGLKEYANKIVRSMDESKCYFF